MPRQARWWILTYVCVSAVVHLIVAARACAPAQDTIRFMNYSRRLLNEPVARVLTSEGQHPLFPVLGALVTRCMIWLGAEPTATTYWRCLQLTSALAGVLVIPALFWIAERVAGRVAAIWGTAIVAFSPRVVGVGADGLSDSLHLVLVAWALVCLCRAAERVDDGGKLWWGLGGILGGLAFLTRPEGALAVAVALVVLGLAAVAKRHRRAAVLRGVTTAAALLAVFVGGFFLLTGRLSTKASVARMVGLQVAEAESTNVAVIVGPFSSPQRTAPFKRRPLFDNVVYVGSDGGRMAQDSFPEPHRPSEGDGHGPLPAGLNLWTAVHEYVKELSSATQYVGLVLACLGVPVAMRRRLNGPGAALLAIFVCFTCVLLRLYLTSGYISMRHLLVPVLCLVPFVGEGAVWLIDQFAPWAGRRLLGSASHRRRARAIALGCLLGGLLICYIPVYWKPLHASRAGAMAAAQWLFQQAQPGDAVFDAHLISGAMAGLPTYGLAALPHAVRDPRLAFVVVDRSDLWREDHPYDRIRAFVRERGREVARFLVPDRPDATTIVFQIGGVQTAEQGQRRNLR